MSSLKRILGLSFSLLLGARANAEIHLQNPEFTFSLPAGWVQVQGNDPEQWKFESTALKTDVVLSIVPKLHLKKDRLIDVARKFASIRKDAEQQGRPGQKITYGDESVELMPSGDVAQISYAAFDETGSIFRFIGFVTQGKVLSFWITTSGKDNALSKRAFDEAFRGLKFQVP